MNRSVGTLSAMILLMSVMVGCTQAIDTQTPERTIISTDPEQCSLILFHCDDGMRPWFSDEGCGCEEYDRTDTPNHEVDMTLCAATSWPVGACTREYNPVCGWFDESVQCVTYPCAATYSNPCIACSDENVIGWTAGECETQSGTI
jgi:hypothetical protein